MNALRVSLQCVQCTMWLFQLDVTGCWLWEPVPALDTLSSINGSPYPFMFSGPNYLEKIAPLNNACECVRACVRVCKRVCQVGENRRSHKYWNVVEHFFFSLRAQDRYINNKFAHIALKQSLVEYFESLSSNWNKWTIR